MTEATDWHDLKFHRELYAGEAVDEAVQRYRKHIEVEMHELPDVWHLRLRSIKPGLTRRVAHELANYALGLTIQRGGPT